MGVHLPVGSLRGKALAFVLGVAASFVAATYLLQHAIVQPEFAAIEAREAEANLARAIEGLQSDAEFLGKLARDYAAWDDTYAFVATRDAAYADANLTPQTLSNLGLDLAAIVTQSGEVVWGRRLDAQGELVEDPELIAALTAREHRLVGHVAPDSKREGVLATPAGLLLAGSAAITDNALEAPPRGSVIFARFLDAAQVTLLSGRTRLDLAISSLDAVAGQDRAALAHLAPAAASWHDGSGANALRGATLVPGATWHDTSSPSLLHGYSVVAGVDGAPALLVRVDLRRETSLRAADAARLAVWTSAVGGLAIFAILWWATARFLLRPLERSRAEIVLAAQHAGRAQAASAVLHDVGNVLNSVTVSSSVAASALARSELPALRAAVDLLARQGDQLPGYLAADAQGPHLVAFLGELAGQLEGEQELVQAELKALGASIEHVAALVRAQGRYSEAAPLLEQVAPAALVEQALALGADAFQRDALRVERRIETREPVRLDRHRCLQVLANLLSNAKLAVRDAGRGAGRIEIRVARTRDAGGEWLDLEVADDGAGIEAAHLERIFALGFSTRPDGHGIGLHTAANLAREMGGSLSAASAGPGRGATFTLRIPVPAGGPP